MEPPVARPYCGVVGYFDLPNMDLAINIRSALLGDGTA